MKKLGLGQTLGILANLGVIAGIIFLAYELQQNNLYLREQARYNVFQNRLSANLLPVVDPDIARLWNWQETDEPLNELDGRRRADLLHTNFLRWQHDFHSLQLGTVDAESFPLEGMKRTFHGRPGHDEVWAARKAGYSPDFVEWMEETIVNER